MTQTETIPTPQDEEDNEAIKEASQVTDEMGSDDKSVQENENKPSVSERASSTCRDSENESETPRPNEPRSASHDSSNDKERSIDKIKQGETHVVVGPESTASDEKGMDKSGKQVMVPNNTEEKDEKVSTQDKDETPPAQSPSQNGDSKPSPQGNSRILRSQTAAKEDKADESPSSTPRRSHKSNDFVFPRDDLRKLKSNLDTHESLDEDAVALKFVQTDRVVTERTQQVVLPNVCDDSEDEEEEFQRVYRQELEIAILQHEFKHAVRGVEKKSANWLRNALGMKRRHAHHHHHHHSSSQQHPNSPGSQGEESDNENDGSPPAKTTTRRLTRGMARSTRIRKREERVVRENQGLDALVSAVKELEGEHGPFPALPPPKDEEEEEEEQHRTKRSRLSGSRSNTPSKQSRSKKKKDEESPSSKSKGSKRKRPELQSLERKTKKSSNSSLLAVIHKPVKSKRKAAEQTITVRVVRIVVNGRRVKPPQPGDSLKGIKTPSKKKKASAKFKKSPTTNFTLHGSPSSGLSDEEGHPKKKRRTWSTVDDYDEEEEVPPGRLFGEIRRTSMGPDIMSLSLLDWKRRQQWTPANTTNTNSTKKSKPEDGIRIKLPSHIVKAGIDAGLPSWDTVNPIPRVPREPSSTMEPSRRRHSTATYASWCNKLINFINGSGRMMAHYEFFYSDIDRAWFNENEFEMATAMLGIPPTMKLTRSEWSLVRRRIRKRPRRFSKKFIVSQMQRLNRYRAMVRVVQNNPKEYRHFSYDVPAPIRVGATVTAFNKKAHLLHRGIVLARDEELHGYLIQFERKELGFEFCPDTDVASHGIPDIVVPAVSMALDGTRIFPHANHHAAPGALAYGTSCNQLSEFREDQKHATLQRLIRLPTTLPTKNSKATPDLNDDPLETPAAADETEKDGDNKMEDLVEKVAEREMLVKLIGLVDTALIRKEKLLYALNMCQIMLQQYKEKYFGGKESPNEKQIQSLTDHYSWLHANLGLTNQSLEAALAHLQIMYSRGYGGSPRSVDRFDAQTEQLEVEGIIKDASVFHGQHHPLADDNEERDDNNWHKPWTGAILRECAATGKEASRKSLKLPEEGTDEKEQSPRSTMNQEDGSNNAFRERFLEHRLDGASQLLLALDYGREAYPDGADTNNNESNSFNKPTLVGPRIVMHARAATMSKLAPKPLARDTECNPLLQEMDQARRDAFRELGDSLFLLESEMEAQQACKALGAVGVSDSAIVIDKN